MSRSNIFEILHEKVDIDNEIITILELFYKVKLFGNHPNYDIEHFCDEFCIPFWKSRRFVTSCDDMRERLAITDDNIEMGLDRQHMLILIEYILNVIMLCDQQKPEDSEWSMEFNMLFQNIKNLVEYLNYEIKVVAEQEKTILIEKNAAATAVAEIMDKETAYSVIEYNHFLLKGNLPKKQQILKILGDKFEGKKSQIKSINNSLASDIGFLLNKLNVRHNNLEGKSAEAFIQTMSSEELEQWYDDTYQLLLLAFLELDNVTRRQKVNELKQRIFE